MVTFPGEAFLRAKQVESQNKQAEFNPFRAFGSGLGSGMEQQRKSVLEETANKKKANREYVAQLLKDHTPMVVNPAGATLAEKYTPLPINQYAALAEQLYQGKAPENIEFLPKGMGPQLIYGVNRVTGEQEKTGEFVGSEPKFNPFGYAPRETMEDKLDLFKKKEAIKLQNKMKAAELINNGSDKVFAQLKTKFVSAAKIADPKSLSDPAAVAQARQDMLDASSAMTQELLKRNIDLPTTEVVEIVTPKYLLGVIPWGTKTEYAPAAPAGPGTATPEALPWTPPPAATPAPVIPPSVKKGTPPPMAGYEGQKIKSKKTGITWTYTNGKWQ